MGRREDDSSTSSDSYRRSKKAKKHKKAKEKKERRKRRHYSSEDESTSSHSDSNQQRRKHRKKSHKKEKRHKSDKSRSKSEESLPSLERNVLLTDALCELFNSHPGLVDDLPIMLVRMGGGATFDLSQMTNRHASLCLEAVFRALMPLGVGQDDSGTWQWTGPKNDLVLIRVVRAMLDQIGLTEEAVDNYESDLLRAAQTEQTRLAEKSNIETSQRMAQDLLKEFQSEGQLSKELASLCTMLMEGESIAIDELPNETLRNGLERLFTTCNLEKAEMENDESDDDNGPSSNGAVMGYSLPDDNVPLAKSMLQAVIQVCRDEDLARNRGRRVVTGPMRNPEDYAGQTYQAPLDDSDDDEGPSPFDRNTKQSPASAKMVKEAAEKRARELEYAKTGVMPPSERDGTVREEWMVDPGKFDFLSNIKSGQPVRSRGFQAQGAIAGEGVAVKRKDPKIQAEIDAIMQAHEEARGPSLMELHRQKKAQESAEASHEKNGAQWKWDRDTDLSAGRRVDKANLNMVWGGAGTDLKQKFHKGK